MRQIVLDTETTGLEIEQGHRIIEIGALEMIDRRLSGRQLHYYLNPGRKVDAGALEIHGISDEFLEDKPAFADIAEEFLEFIADAELLIHNAPFDIGFLDYELGLDERDLGRIGDRAGVLDTLELARELHPGQRNSLDALCRRYEIDNSNRSLHGALLDARLLAEVYLAMTGGQSSLGLALREEHAPSEQQVEGEFAHAGNLVVLKPSEGELERHRARLLQIEDNSGGKCLWLELEG